MSFSTGFRKCKKCGKTLFGLFDGELCDKCEKAKQEPCDDAVSRQAVLDCFNNKVTLPCDMDTGLLRAYLQAVVDAISKLPPVRPQEQTGHWIEIAHYSDGKHKIECSECGSHIFDRGHANSFNVKNKYKYCPNCGAKMVEPTCDTCKYNTAAFMPCNACDNKSLFEPQESEVRDETNN